jgi:hypothetical protein
VSRDQAQPRAVTRRRAIVLAAGPVLGAIAGALTNLVTARWNWWLFIALMVVVTAAAILVALSEDLSTPTPDMPRPNPSLYKLPQERALRHWRLFGLAREIWIDKVYVNEVLEQESPGTPLRRIYVRVEIAEDDVFAAATGPLQDAPALFLVEGGAGSGKSTILRKWALRLLSLVTDTDSQPPIPLFVGLRNLSIPEDIAFDDQKMGEAIGRAAQRTLPGLGTDAVKRCLAHIQHLAQVEAGTRKRRWRPRTEPRSRLPAWIFLLDGLDELPVALRPAVLHWASGLPTAVRAVVTSRPVPGVVAPDRSRQYEICDFKAAQIEQFINQWFEDKPNLAASFHAVVGANESLRSLATIPLLLTCLCLDVEFRGDATFPQQLRKTELLDRIVEIMLDVWDAAKEPRSPDPRRIELGIHVLKEIAAEHRRVSLIVSYEELSTKIRHHARALRIDAVTADGVLERITSSGRLLMGDREHGYFFAHSLFFEYFFSVELLDLHKRELGRA